MPVKRRPVLIWERDEEHEALELLATKRVGGIELSHDLNRPQRVDMSHAVIACGACGGLRGGDGMKPGVGSCPTKRCECRGGGAR